MDITEYIKELERRLDTLERFSISNIVLTEYTTAERDALTPHEGLTILNTTLNKVQTYINSAWVSLH